MTSSLQVGEAKVEWVSAPGASSNPQETYKEFIKTVGSAVCKGDSGGASYSNSDPRTKEVVGLASKGNLSTDSYLVSVVDPHISAFFKEFQIKYNVQVCGVDGGAKNCRF